MEVNSPKTKQFRETSSKDAAIARSAQLKFCGMCAALRMTWTHSLVIVPGAVLWTGGVEKIAQQMSIRGCQLCTQVSTFEGSVVELLRFSLET